MLIAQQHFSRSFVRAGCMSAFLTVVTTLLVHLLYQTPAAFEEQVLLYQQPVYKLRLWITIFHCVLVIISMGAIAYICFHASPGLIGLGFLSFVVFSLAEIVRMFMALYYANSLRRLYHEAVSELNKTIIRGQLEGWNYISLFLFNLFIIAFAIGCLCYGIALLRTQNGKFSGAILIVWGTVNLFSFLNSQQGWLNMESFMEKFSITYQPFARFVVASWLWRFLVRKN